VSTSQWREWARIGASAVARAGAALQGPSVSGATVLARWLLRITIFVLLLTPAALVVWLVEEGWRGPPTHAATAMWLSLALVATAVSWFTVSRLLHVLAGALRLPVFGASWVPRLAAAALVMLVAPSLPRPAVTGALWAVTQLGIVIPLSIARGAGALQELVGPEDVVSLDFLLKISGHFLRYTERQLTTFGDNLLDRLPISNLALALASWALLAIGIRAALDAGAPKHLASYLRSRPKFNLSNVGFVAILTISAFLSLAAVLCLPRLREGTLVNKDVEPAVLEQLLRGQMLTESQVLRYLPDDLKRDPLSTEAGAPKAPELPATATPAAPPSGTAASVAPGSDVPKSDAASPKSTAAGAADASAAAPGRKDGPDDASEEYRRFVFGLADQRRLSFRSRYQELVKNGKELGAALLSNESKAALVTVKEYQLKNSKQQGSREELQHFLLIQSWFFAGVAADEGALRWCATLIRQNQQALDAWSDSAFRMRRTLGEESAFSANVSAAMNELETQTVTAQNQLYGASQACSARAFGAAPEPPPLGASLGPLQIVAGWLLDAGSLPLALIVGMMGFGLLGAVISTFVRERRDQTLRAAAPHSIVVDLAGVMLRGLSAAIVVFLAVQGGLAVLSGAGSDPNPYVLLLACFVAAVFSERVWSSAQQYLSERLPATAEPPSEEVKETPSTPGASAGVLLHPPSSTRDAG